jgi:uncharacterized protein YbjQ (UPF0145 family)
MATAPENIILTTGYEVAGFTIEREIDVITAECAYGMNIFKDFLAAVRDVVGGRSQATEEILREAKTTALNELRMEAVRVGGDAVIAIDLDYHELSGGGKNGMLLVVASGTAVRISR